jgi:predicted permease
VSLALLTGTTLFVRSLRNLQFLDAGFNRHGALILTAGFGPVGIAPERAVSYRQELVDHLRAIPGVEGVTELTVVPLTGADWNNRMWMDGSDISRARVSMRSMVGAQYFQVMGMALLAGRDFEDHDMNSVAKVAVVDQEFARQFNGGANPVGRRLWIEPTPTERSTSYEIVGLVRNAKYRDLREPFQPVVFVPMTREAQESAGGRFLIRSSAPMAATSAGVRAMLPTIIPGVRYSLRVFDEWVDDSLLRERLMVALSGWYGVLAIALTAVGLYGVISYTVARRTNEIGIRMALGAGRGAVTTMILRETASILGAGLAFGTLLALAAARFSAGLLFDLEWWDPRALAFAASALAIVAAAASYLPASRAASLNPVAALRQE